MTARAIGGARRVEVDTADGVEQVVRVVVARRCRPVVAAATDIVEGAIGVAMTRSRIPDGRVAKLAREVYTFVGTGDRRRR